jgi:hypothetical protein
MMCSLHHHRLHHGFFLSAAGSQALATPRIERHCAQTLQQARVATAPRPPFRAAAVAATFAE